MNAEEIQQIQDAACRIKPAAGIINRDTDGNNVARGSWETTYLHTGGQVFDLLPELMGKIRRAVYEIDQEHWGLLTDLAEDEVNVRCVEYHEYYDKGRLRHLKHHDTGSLITVDFMLSAATDFVGGDFQTLEADGSLLKHSFEQGDLTAFVSHKFHAVGPIDSGRRNVMIVEFWRGPQRQCAHRCLCQTGECKYTFHASYRDRMLLAHR